jgi:branched-chain amino acid aminotransferase
MELCDEYGLKAQVAPISRESLESADEVFVTSTAGGVIAITRVATTILGNDKPGAITTILKDAYWKKHTEGWHRAQVRALDLAFAASLT